MHGEYVEFSSSSTLEFNNKLSQTNTILSGMDFRVARKIRNSSATVPIEIVMVVGH